MWFCYGGLVVNGFSRIRRSGFRCPGPHGHTSQHVDMRISIMQLRACDTRQDFRDADNRPRAVGPRCIPPTGSQPPANDCLTQVVVRRIHPTRHSVSSSAVPVCVPHSAASTADASQFDAASAHGRGNGDWMQYEPLGQAPRLYPESSYGMVRCQYLPT